MNTEFNSYKVRPYRFDLLPDELKETVKKTPPVRFESVKKARFGIFMMHLFMPKVDEDGVRIEDLKIKRPSLKKADLKIRIYEPESKLSEKRLGMVFMHWGGFVVGNLKTEHQRCVRLCRDENIVVVSVEYRLAPENPYPLGLNDCETALRWFHENCKRFGVEESDIGVGGTSAGGGLAASLCIKDLKAESFLVNYQYLGFPVLDQSCSSNSAKLHKETPNWTSAANKLMWKYYLGEQAPSEISSPSLSKNLENLPETFIWTAEFDPLHDEAVEFARNLKAYGVKTKFFDYKSCIHGFDSIPVSAGVIKEAHKHQSEFFFGLRNK